jgi:hypothetical protein
MNKTPSERQTHSNGKNALHQILILGMMQLAQLSQKWALTFKRGQRNLICWLMNQPSLNIQKFTIIAIFYLPLHSVFFLSGLYGSFAKWLK